MLRKAFQKFLQNELVGIGFTLFVLCASLLIFTKGFFSAYNIDSLARDVAIFTIVGMSQMVTLGVGQFNLAVGAIGGAAGMVCGAMLELLGVPFIVAIIAGLIVGYALGYFQGLLIVKTKINPFIITLALISVYHGINMTITQNVFFRNLPDNFKAIAKASVFRIPVLVIIVIAIMLIFWFLFNRTVIGRKMLATGVSTRAADYAGINSAKVTMTAHGLSGLLAAAAGILTISKLGAAQTSIGTTWLLISFAAPILGGTLLSGGKVSIAGTFIGATLMTVLTNALVLFGVNFYWFQTFTGSILLLAFAANKLRSTMSYGQDNAIAIGGKKIEQSK